MSGKDDPVAVLIEAAQAARRSRDFDNALGQYRQAASLTRKSEDEARLAHCLRHVSELSLELGDPQEALASGYEATELYRALGNDPLGLANALRVSALAHGATDQRNLAAPCWAEARKLYDELGVTSGVAECDSWLQANSKN